MNIDLGRTKADSTIIIAQKGLEAVELIENRAEYHRARGDGELAIEARLAQIVTLLSSITGLLTPIALASLEEES